jgi:hypothetical protein
MSCFAWLVVCLEARIRRFCSGLQHFHFLLVFLFPTACLLPAGQGHGKPTPIVYFGICLIAWVAVCIFFTVFVGGGVFFFFPSPSLFWFLFCFAFPHPHWLSVLLKVLNTKILTERKIV